MSDNKNENFFQKLTKLFRYGPLVKRKIMTYDSTLALPGSDGSSSKMLFQKSTNMNYTEALAGTYQYADRVARYQDFGEMEYCLSGDTKIAVPGGFKTLKELSHEFGVDKQFVVFSYDHNKRALVAAKAKQARKTRTDQSFKVKLSNGKEIIGSANHRLLLRNGRYCRIDQLKNDDSLMPFFDKTSRGNRQLYLPRPNNGNFWVKEKELLDSLSDDYQNNFKKTNTFGTIVELYCNATQDKNQICYILDLSDEEFNEELKTAGYGSFQTFERAYMIRSRKKTKRDSTIDDVYFNFRSNMNLNALASTLNNKNVSEVNSMLLNDGFNDAEELLDEFKYVTVESVEPNGVIDLYDLTVDGYKNFATDSVISHNTPEIAAALDIYADETCLAGNTIVPLLDGTKKTIKELYESKEKDFWLYSFDIKNSKFVPGLAKEVVKTGTKQLYKITFDDNTFVRLTDNHRVLLSNGEYKQVSDLNINDSIRSMYTKVSSFKNGDAIDGYEQILNPDNNWKYTHRIIAEHAYSDKKGTVHHVNFNKRDNRPSNLQFMTRTEHKLLHCSLNSYRWKNDLEYSEKMSGIFRDNAKKLHKRAGFTDFFLKRRDEVFSSYNQETRKSLFGRKGKQNGMYNSGFKISGDKNGRWDSNLIREISKEQLIAWIFSGESQKSICQKYPVNENIIRNAMKKYGIKKWSKKHATNSTDILKLLKSWISKQNDKTNIHRNLSKACKELGISRYQAYIALEEFGYKTWQDYLSKTNHRVISIELDEIEDVYDLEVNEWHNFAISGDKEFNSYIIVHNCAQDDRGRSLHIHSNNLKIQNILEELFYNTLNVEFSLRSWARSLCKYGDMFLYTDVSPKHGVVNTFPIPVAQIEREENFDSQDPFAVRFRWTTRGLKFLENWEVTHMRLLGNDMFLPYGSSIVEPARRIWRQLCISKGTDIWVKGFGYKKIEDILPNDIILSFNPETKELKEAKVKKVKYMGKQKTVLVKTAHREIKVTPNHGLLIKDKDGNFYYKKAEELIATNGRGGNSSRNSDKLVLPSRWETNKESYSIKLPDSIYNGNKIYKSKRNSFLNNNHEFETTKEFMRLFGFMFGDGWSNFEKGKNYRTGFALGTDQKQNNFYISLFQNLFPSLGEMKLSEPIKNKRGGQVNFNSKELSCLFNELGFKTGFKNKRIPSWVYELNVENKIEFIKGIFDADGSKSCDRLCLSNKELLEDVKVLAQQTGICVGSSVKIDRKSGEYNDKRFGKINRETSYRLYLNLNKIETQSFITENVCKVISDKIEDTFDLEVDHENHNFTANGIISHNTLIEDAMLVYRLVRAPERRVFYVDVGNMPPENVSTYVEQLRKSMKTSQIVDKSSGKIDLRYNPQAIEEDFYIPVRGSDTGTKIESLAGGQNTSAVEDVEYLQKKLIAALKIPRAYLGYDEALSCLTGDSKIKLLDGTSISIEELANRKLNGDFEDIWVYSFDIKNNKMVPGKVKNAWKTKEVNKLYHVKLDNGHIVKCTENHPFLLRDGTYKRADELLINDSLMPLYFKKSVSKKHSGSDLINGYEMFLNNKTNEFDYTHKSVYESFSGGNFKFNKQRVIHHNDCNKLNNNPNNLVEMTWYEHRKWHSERLNTTLLRPDVVEKRKQILLKWLKSDKHRTFKSDMMKTATTTPGNIHYERIHSQEHANKMSNVIKNNWQNENYRNIKTLQSRLNWTKEGYKNKFVGENHWTRKKNLNYDIEWLKDFCIKNNITSITQWRKDNLNSVSGISPVGIRYVKSLILRSGFNSWKEFKSSLNYNHKIFSIEVISYENPISVFDIEVDEWHNFLLDSGDNSGIFVHNSKATLAQEDIRFSRTISVIQRTILAELNKLAVIHLFCLGFDGDDLMNFNLKLSNPSTIAQIQKMELWKSKFELAGSAPEGMLSKTFIRKELIGLTDSQIEEIDEDRINEKLKETEIENAASEDESSDDEETGDDSEDTGEESEESGSDAEDKKDAESEIEDLFSSKNRLNVLPITASKFANPNLLTSTGINKDIQTNIVDEIVKTKKKKTPKQRQAMLRKNAKRRKKNRHLIGLGKSLNIVNDKDHIKTMKNLHKTDMMISKSELRGLSEMLMSSKEPEEKFELSQSMKNMLVKMNEKFLKKNKVISENNIENENINNIIED